MRNLLSIAVAILILCAPTQINAQAMKNTIYQFKVKDIEGNDFDFAKLKGKKILVVNTASKCGLTPQFEDLQKLYDSYKDKNLVVVGFPANNFNQQDPGTNEEIAAFCQKNYGVTFPMMEKVSVKGSDASPIYQWLTQEVKNGVHDSEVEWNFHKFLIDENGHLVKELSPKVTPLDPEIVTWVKS